MQIDADPDPDSAYHFDADPDANPAFQCESYLSMRIRIRNTDISKENKIGTVW
jgi:hypothetical protein